MTALVIPPAQILADIERVNAEHAAGDARHSQVAGTPKGRRWHRTHDVPVCDDCRTAFNAHQRERRSVHRIHSPTDEHLAAPETPAIIEISAAAPQRSAVPSRSVGDRYSAARAEALAYYGTALSAVGHEGKRTVAA